MCDRAAIEAPEVGTDSEPVVRFSVIVPVYNRADQLRRLLAALARQTCPLDQFEVLICDDGSSQDLLPLIDEVASRSGLRLIHLSQARGGPGMARNLGLAHARGPIVAFTDSDCVPDPRWLSELGRAFADPAVGLVGGRVDYRGAQQLSGRCINFLMSSMLGGGGARDPRGPIHMEYYPRTCNLAVSRSLAVAVEGFPRVSHGEDLEFSHKVRGLGVDVRFVPDASIVHDERRTLLEIARESFLKGRTRVHLAQRLRMHQLIHGLPAALVLYASFLTITCVMAPSPALPRVIPGLLYLLVLAILAVQGAVALREIRAMGWIPVCALTMHFGYGLGYLSAVLRFGEERFKDLATEGYSPKPHDLV